MMRIGGFLSVGLTVVLFSSGCTKRPVVRTLHPARADVEATVATISSGTVEAESQAQLGFGVAGRVARVSVQAGDKVEKDQLLAELENTDLKVIYQEASKELGRVKQLFDEKLVSRVAFDDARKAFEVARATFDKATIRAPFSGIVTEVNLRVGELASPQTTKAQMRLVDLKPRIVKGEIDEIDLAKVKMTMKARIRVPAARPEPFTAEVTRVVPYIDTTKDQDRVSPIELRMAPTESPVPVGASAEIEIVVGEKKGVLAVPARVVLGSGQQRHVFVVRDGKLVKQTVELGMGNYERSEVISGIAEGDAVAFPSDDVAFVDGLKVRMEPVTWP